MNSGGPKGPYLPHRVSLDGPSVSDRVCVCVCVCVCVIVAMVIHYPLNIPQTLTFPCPGQQLHIKHGHKTL